MHPLLEYKKFKEEECQQFKQRALQMFDTGNMTREQFERFLDRMYRYGHYAGHCQGEYYVKVTHGLDKTIPYMARKGG